MLGETYVRIDVGDILAGLTALCVVLGIPTWLNARWVRRTSRHVDEIGARVEPALRATHEISRQVKTSNGDSLAEIIEQTAETASENMRMLEVVNGRLHDVSKRVDAQGREISSVGRTAQANSRNFMSIARATDEVHADLRTHLDMVTPLIEEYVQMKEEEGGE